MRGGTLALLCLAAMAGGGESAFFGLDMARSAFKAVYDGFDCNLRWPLQVDLTWKWGVPTGVKWRWEGVGVCKKFNAENMMGEWQEEFGCWGPLLDFAWGLKDSLSDVEELDAGVANDLTNGLIKAVVANQVCLAESCTSGGISAPGALGHITKNFCLKSGEEEAQKKLEGNEERNILISLPAINNNRYADFITGMTICYSTSGVNCSYLKTTLIDYIKDSISAMVGGFVELKDRMVWYVVEPLMRTLDVLRDLGSTLDGVGKCALTSSSDKSSFNNALAAARASANLAMGLRDTALFINDTLAFARELKEVYDMFKAVQSGKNKDKLGLLKKVADIPHEMADLIEAFQDVKQLPGKFRTAKQSLDHLATSIITDIPRALGLIKPESQQGNAQCKSALAKLKSFGVSSSAIGTVSNAFDVSEVIKRVRNLFNLQLSFKIGAPVFHNYLTFKYRENIRLPKVTWTNQCMDKWVKGLSIVSPAFAIAVQIAKKRSDFCVRRPKIEWNEGRMFPDVPILPGFIPFISIRSNIYLPPKGTRIQ